MQPTTPSTDGRPAARVEVLERLGELSEHWDDIVGLAAAPSPFLRSWWLGGVATDRARYLVVFEGDELAGGLAIEQTRRVGCEVIRELGAGALCPDHTDYVCRPGREAVVEAALAAWLGRPGNRLIELTGVDRGARLVGALPGRASVSELDVAPYTPIAGDFDGFVSSLPGGVKKRVRRAAKSLENQGIVPRTVDAHNPAEVERSLRDLERLHVEQWGRRSGFVSAFPRFCRAARLGMACGELVIDELVRAEDGEVVATTVTLENHGRASTYQGGRSLDRRWAGSGNVLMARVAERAFAAGFHEIDLLRGSEPWKAEWSAATRPLVQIRAASGPYGRAVLAATGAARRLRPVASRARQAVAKVRARFTANG